MGLKERAGTCVTTLGFKNTDLGDIPEDWEITTVGEIAEKIGSGKTPSGGNRRYVDSGRPFVRSQNVGWGRLLLDDLAFIDEATHREFPATEIRSGDVLLNITGASIGRSAFASDRLRGGNVNQHVCIVRTTNTNALLVNHLLLSAVGQSQIESFQAGGNREGLNFRQVRSIQVVVPIERAEQSAIAGVLSDADALIESLEQLLAKKRQIKQGAMQELLACQRRLPGFTTPWRLKRLGDFAPLQRGFDLPLALHRPGRHPVVASNGVLSYHAQFKVCGPGVVTGRSGTIGNVHFVDRDFWPHNTALWVTSFNGNDPKFVFYKYAHVGFERFATGSGVPTLNRNDAHAFVLNVPSLRDEQTAIATTLSDMDAEITALEARLAKTRLLKQGMAQALLTGRIRLVPPQEEQG